MGTTKDFYSSADSVNTTIKAGVGQANQLVIAGSSTGNPVTITASGIDANIDVNIITKGAGVLKVNGVVVGSGGGGPGGTINGPFVEHVNTVSSNYAITSGYNAVSAGPITINNGVTVSVPNGSTWVIV